VVNNGKKATPCLNQEVKDAILAVALQTEFSLSAKFSINLGWYAKDVYTCFVDLEKAYDRVPQERFRGVLQEYGVDGCMLLAIKSLYSCSEVCVRVDGVKSQPFTVGVGLRILDRFSVVAGCFVQSNM